MMDVWKYKKCYHRMPFIHIWVTVRVPTYFQLVNEKIEFGEMGSIFILSLFSMINDAVIETAKFDLLIPTQTASFQSMWHSGKEAWHWQKQENERTNPTFQKICVWTLQYSFYLIKCSVNRPVKCIKSDDGITIIEMHCW